MFWNPITVYVARKLNNWTSYVATPPVSSDKNERKNVLIVHCHPSANSFSNCILNAVITGLMKSGQNIRLRKLYLHDRTHECYNGQDFPPSLTKGELEKYDKLGKYILSEIPAKALIANEVHEAVTDLLWCDAIVFVYPIWWSNFPGVLKGYFDRVLLEGVAFNIGKSGIVGQLTNISKVGVVTTYGAPFSAVILSGDNSRRFISRVFRSLCQRDCQLLYLGLYNTTGVSNEERKKFLAFVEDAYAHF